MKHLTLSVAAFVLLALAGCSFAFRHSNYNDGFDFPGENVNKIIIGKTTDDELIKMFGGPFAKFKFPEDEEDWRYSYSTGIETEEKGFLTDNVQSTGQRKMLDILIKNGTVVSFTYTQSSEPLGSTPNM